MLLIYGGDRLLSSTGRLRSLWVFSLHLQVAGADNTVESTMSQSQLLHFSDGEFDTAIQGMNLKSLLEAISMLQKEMAKEQENFNSLNKELTGQKKNSGQYKQISRELNKSQERLTQLMNRSMKCFAQQGNHHQGKPKSGSTIPRKNSVTSSSKPEPFEQVVRNHSMHETQELKAVSIPGVDPSNDTVKPVLLNATSSIDTRSVNLSVSHIQNQSQGQMTQNGVNGHSDISINKSNEMNAGADSDYCTNAPSWQNSSRTIPNKVVSDGHSDKLQNHFKNTENSHTGSLTNETNKFSSHATPGGILSKQENTHHDAQPHARVDKPDSASSDTRDIQRRVDKAQNMFFRSMDGRNPLPLNQQTQKVNLLVEIKNFDKELKPTATRSGTVALTELKPHGGKDKTSDGRNKLFSEIKLKKINTNEEAKFVEKAESFETENSGSFSLSPREKEGKIPEPVCIQSSLEPEFEPSSKLAGQREITLIYEPLELHMDGSSSSEENEGEKEEFVTEANLSNIPDAYVPAETLGILSKSTKQDVRPKERSSTNTPGSSSPLPSREREVASQYPVEIPASVILSKTADAETNKPPILLTNYSNQAPLEQNDVTVFSNASETPDSAPSQQSEIKSTVPQITVNHGNAARVSNQGDEGEEEEFHARINLKNWDPSKLLKELYKVTLMPDNIEDISYKFVTMEGLMEKLPMNKKKATLLKTWKRRFFKATDGWLHYYETSNRDKPSDSIQLMGGKIENLGNRVIGVDDGRGRFLMVRAPSDREHGQWILAMESQTADNVKATYVRPALSTPPHTNKRVLILDIGSCGIRAGILGESPCLPTLFFPSIVAEDKQSGELSIGIDSFKPEVRHQSILKYPVLPTNKVDKFNIDMDVMPMILSKVLKDLSLNPKTAWVMIGTPQNLGDKLKEGLMKILVDKFHMKGACMVQQSLLALYSYRTDTGIIVDIGNRMEVLPIYEGVLIEGGVSRQVCGGQKVADSLHISLLENKYKFSTPVEKLIVRYIMEKSCYVVEDYSEAKKKCDADPDSFRTTVSLNNFDLPEGAHLSVTHDYSCFKSAEGLFNTDLWGIDYPTIQRLVFQAIQACPMDSRKHMYRSIYLSGGVTMLPGFAERLQTELKKLAPPSVVVEVHASPQRYHSAYIGACTLAGMDVFEKSCISAEEWRQMGTKAFKKWSTNSSS
ncbi:hypothetical protein CHS0354_035654 [Potamilus streckersoni]|uniref:PH domain-containing protein n=1 Tax=Potamilus streckersoni TaxID=2493646 RepID=A0AAE0RS88_9BIVA|nr:hypothetical protein CHS0354_035654 [Potamilus streckersoni]